MARASTAMAQRLLHASTAQLFWRLIARLTAPTQCCILLVGVGDWAFCAASISVPVRFVCALEPETPSLSLAHTTHALSVCCALPHFRPFIGASSTIKLALNTLRPSGVAATPSGVLIVSCECNSRSVYAIDPLDGRCELISHTASKGEANYETAYRGVVVADNERCAYVCDSQSEAIRRITLPPKFFLTRTTSLHRF